MKMNVMSGGLASVVVMAAVVAGAAEPVKVRLWPEGAPGAKGDSDTDQPFVEVWRAEAANDSSLPVARTAMRSMSAVKAEAAPGGTFNARSMLA